jgi:hypothetical protein
MSMSHDSPKKSTRIAHGSLGPGIIPSVSHIRRKIRRHQAYIVQGELKKIKPPTFNGEHRKGEKSKA